MRGTRVLFLFLGCLLLAGCDQTARPKLGGDEVANGGDELPGLFEKGKIKANRILDTVEALIDEDFPQPWIGGTEVLKNFYKINRQALREDIEGLLPFQWVGVNVNGACGHTFAYERAPITLSYRDCRAIIRTATDAALHTLGEACHHLGIADDSFTGLLKLVVGSAWNRVLGLSSESLDRRMLFARGSVYASEMLQRIQSSDLPLHARESIAPEDWAWLVENRRSLATDVLTRRHHWVDEIAPRGSELGRCAAVESQPEMVVSISYSGCDSSIKSPLQAAYALLLATLEGKFPGQVQRILKSADAVMTAWYSIGHSENPHFLMLEKAPTDRGEQLKLWPTLWNGKEVWAWEPSDPRYRLFDENGTRFYAFNPSTNQWRSFDAPNAFRQWFNPVLDAKDELFASHTSWVDGKIVTLTDCFKETRRAGAGHRFDPSVGRFELVTSEGAPNRKYFSTVVLGDKLVVWGGESCEGDRLVDGAVYDPHTDQWAPIAEIPSFRPWTGYSVTAAGQNLILWGGCVPGITWQEGVGLPRIRCNNDGALYDFTSRKWRPLPSEGAPVARTAHDAVWTGKYLVIFGGIGRGVPGPPPSAPLEEFDFFDKLVSLEGGRFNLDENRWEPMSPTNRPQLLTLYPNLQSSVVWTGTHLVTLGRHFSAYNPQRDEWIKMERVIMPRGRWLNMFWTGMEILLWNGGYDNVAFYP